VLIGYEGFAGAANRAEAFGIGTVVRHERYHYRGVIVAVDPSCSAGDAWYYSNKTQPSRDQPWYHVLVHDSGGLNTYVAHSNLAEDASQEPINHPRLAAYFGSFENGRYRLREDIGLSDGGPAGACGI
jgi:heat shock protein HspQ